jgi:hypothetical protein
VSERIKRKRIGVVPSIKFEAYRKLFFALSCLFPVEFYEVKRDSYTGLDALIFFGGSREAGIRAATAGVRSCVVLDNGAERVHCGSANVDFGRTPCLHPYFRGQTLIDEDVKEFVPISPLPDDEMVASKDGHVLWIYRPVGRSGIDFLAAGPPKLADDRYLCEFLQPGQFLRLLPLFHFLQEVTKDIAWKVPPLRACLMFDDPNLHSPSYGYINYRDLVQHAINNNYHVSLATIPGDAWRVHSETASFFRKNPSRISLLIHGNNHTGKELATPGPDAHKQALLAQALRRIERFEKNSGLEVSRVMAAPHSACSEDMLPFMRRMGYEAVCIPWDSLFRYNPDHRWSPTTGLDMVDFQGCGLPVMTRIRVRPEWNPQLKAYPDWKTGIILSAFLSQPIIPLGHHQDAGNGMELLAEVADTVNRLGNVVWTDMKGITRSNYMTRLEGGILRIKMYSRSIAVQVPEGVEEILVERPWMAEEGETEMLLFNRVGKETLKLTAGRVTMGIPVQPLEAIELTTVPNNMLHYSDIPSPPFRLWPIARRLMTEGRDRVLPLVSKRKRF